MVKNPYALTKKKWGFFCESHVIEYASAFFKMLT